MAGDLSDDTLELLLDEDAQAYDNLQIEVLGNSESAASVVRHTGAARLAKEDPIEAAAAEKILRATPTGPSAG